MADTAAVQLARTIEDVWGDWRGPVVEEWVFGTREPQAIASAIVGWAEAHLGARVNDVLWYHASVGCSAALTLVDGRDVVVKAHQPRFGAEYLQAMTAVQQHLHECWFPCPEPVGPVAALDVTESFATAALVRPGVPGESIPDLVDAVAALARLTIYLDGAEYIGIDVSPLAPHPLQAIAPGSLYPEPYSPAIRFDDTRALSWVDELAAAARTVVEADSTPSVVTHIDWCPRNVRGDSAGVTSVFDLDSLAFVPETRSAGTAAVAWALSCPGADGLVDVAAIDRFVWAHQRVRDVWFEEAAMRAVRASVVWNLAYTARCEAALGAPSVATASLRSIGASLLA